MNITLIWDIIVFCCSIFNIYMAVINYRSYRGRDRDKQVREFRKLLQRRLDQIRMNRQE
jgi:hypothetical protein